MAHFYATLKGKGSSCPTKTGTKETGLIVHLTSLTLGVKVVASHVNGEDSFLVMKDDGTTIATVK